MHLKLQGDNLETFAADWSMMLMGMAGDCGVESPLTGGAPDLSTCAGAAASSDTSAVSGPILKKPPHAKPMD